MDRVGKRADRLPGDGEWAWVGLALAVISGAVTFWGIWWAIGMLAGF